MHSSVPEVVDLETLTLPESGVFDEWLRTPSMRCGLYVLATGGVDGQSPHPEDEVYVVLGGAATVDVDGRRSPVRKGSLVYVGAGVPHRFVDVAETLQLLVVFGGVLVPPA